MQTFIPSSGPTPASVTAFLPPPVHLKGFRAAIADEIERLIAYLDGLDGDSDLEPDLGSLSATDFNQAKWADGDDGERDDGDLEPSGDECEPSLGSLGSCGGLYLREAQAWSGGSDDDRESDGDCDLEDGHDQEPSLGSLDRMANQEHACVDRALWYAGQDIELDRADFEDAGDTEPSLGSLSGTAPFHLGTIANWTSQTNWAGGGTVDAEPNGDELDGDRAANDDEPIFPRQFRELAAERAATDAEARRLGAIIARLSGAEVRP